MKVKYVVLPEMRMVKCFLTDTQNIANDTLLDVDENMATSEVYHPRYKMPNQYLGVAHCNPNDEWNPELGKQIAYNKARAKLDRSLFKRLQLYVDRCDKHYNDVVNSINVLGRRLSQSHDHRTERIETALKEQD